MRSRSPSSPPFTARRSAAVSSSCSDVISGLRRAARSSVFPEIKLGLLPGAGGTQRLPRIVGPVRAVEMIVAGKPVDAATAKALGIADELAEGPLLQHAIAFARNVVSSRTPLRSGVEARRAAWPRFAPIPRRSTTPRRASSRRTGICARRPRASKRCAHRSNCRSPKDSFASARSSTSCCRASSRVRCATCSAPSARWRRFRECPPTSRPPRSAKPPSSAPARWGAASRCASRTPASRSCCSIRPRKRSIAVSTRRRATTRPRSSAAACRPRRPRRRSPGSRARSPTTTSRTPTSSSKPCSRRWRSSRT